MKNKDAELIKKLEKENQNLKEVSSINEKLKVDVSKFKEKYQNEKQAKETLQNKVEELDYALREQKIMADELGSKVQQLIAEKFSKQKESDKAPIQVGKLDQEALNKFENVKKELEEENENLTMENNNLKENVKKLKKERAENLEKLENLQKQILNGPAPSPTIVGPSGISS